jgi:hypothetical protein
MAAGGVCESSYIALAGEYQFRGLSLLCVATDWGVWLILFIFPQLPMAVPTCHRGR